jgi:uncharacterized Fe-S cluster-containing radical SAM superfamily protein
MEIILRLTDKCCFNCEYCFEKAISYRIFLKMKKNVLENTPAKNIAERIETLSKNSLISLTGGEPFMYSEFTELCNLLTINNTIVVSTNLFSDKIYRFADAINPKKVKCINATFHPREVERFGFYKEFIFRIKYLQGKGFSVRSPFVMYPKFSYMFERYKSDFHSKRITLVPIQYSGIFRRKKYPQSHDDREKKIIKKYSDSAGKKTIDAIDFNKPSCRAGKDFIVIYKDGCIKRCFGDPKVLGNLFEEAHLFKRPEICGAKIHHCPEVCVKYTNVF